MTTTDAPAGTAPADPRFALRFTGDRSAYWRLQIRGALLLLVTLGIYRFWLNTDTRRFLWSGTEIAGDSLEYAGTPFELLIGFLFALAILIPVYTALFLAALDLGTLGQISGTLGFLLLFALGQYAIYRARRYRLSRTILRGLRFHQEGSAIRYAICAMFWWGLTILTLGLAYPWKVSQLERFKIRHTFYGDLQGRFEGFGIGLFLRGLPMWLLLVVPLAVGMLALIGAVDLDALNAAIERGGDDALERLGKDNPELAVAAGFATLCAGISATLSVLLYPLFQTVILRWWLSGIRFGPIDLRSHLPVSTVYGAYLKFTGLSLLFALVLGIAALLFGVATVAIPAKAPTLREAASVLIALGAYVIGMLGLAAIYRVAVMFALWKASVETLEVRNIEVLTHVSAGGRASSSVGEGLADALHVGGI